MLLREQNKVRLDDRLGEYLANLTPEVSDVTISQLHAAGLTREGPETAHWRGRWWTLWGPFDLVPRQRQGVSRDAGPTVPFLGCDRTNPVRDRRGGRYLGAGIRRSRGGLPPHP